MLTERKVRFYLVMTATLAAAALAFMGCNGDPEEEPGNDPYVGLDWKKIADLDLTGDVTLGIAAQDIGAEGIRYKETALGNLIADGIAAYAGYTSGEPVDFAMLNGQNVQGFDPADISEEQIAGIPKGDITIDSLSAGLGDTLYIVTYTGAEIEKIINIFVNSSSSGKWSANCAVLVSKGVSYTVDNSENSGNPPKAVDIKLNGSLLRDKKPYRVAVGNFMAGRNGDNDATSGGGANFVKYGAHKENYSTDTLKNAVAKYIVAKGTVEPVVEGRITGEVPVIPTTTP